MTETKPKDPRLNKVEARYVPPDPKRTVDRLMAMSRTRDNHCAVICLEAIELIESMIKGRVASYACIAIGALMFVAGVGMASLKPPVSDRSIEYKAVIYGGDKARRDFLLKDCAERQGRGDIPRKLKCDRIVGHMIEAMNETPTLRGLKW